MVGCNLHVVDMNLELQKKKKKVKSISIQRNVLELRGKSMIEARMVLVFIHLAEHQGVEAY